jgi:hypothetical protein
LTDAGIGHSVIAGRSSGSVQKGCCFIANLAYRSATLPVQDRPGILTLIRITNAKWRIVAHLAHEKCSKK